MYDFPVNGMLEASQSWLLQLIVENGMYIYTITSYPSEYEILNNVRNKQKLTSATHSGKWDVHIYTIARYSTELGHSREYPK